MGLQIRRIEYRNFRNYQSFLLDGVGESTLFIGPNAVGKTNLIEGIQLTTALHSFRNPKTDHLVNNLEEPAWVVTDISDGDRKLEIALRINEGKKEYFLNGKKKKAQSIRGILPSDLFCPDDLNFIKGSQSIKRNQIDILGSQFSSNYYTVRKDYEKILRQKNRYLKDVVSHNFLQSINEVLALVGAQLYVLRSRLVKELIPYIQDYYYEISNGKEKVTVNYVPSWLKYESEKKQFETNFFKGKEEAFFELATVLENEYEKEHKRHLSLFGPHADKIVFFIEGKNAELFASQGQQRSLVLAYKMAEVTLLKEKLNQSPVLLLDDVMSELDMYRREQLISLFSRETQTFITSTNSGYFTDIFLKKAQVVNLGEDHE